MSKHYCFNKKCSRYRKEAKRNDDANRGVLLIRGCLCWGNCEGPYHPSYCGECGELAVRHDNYEQDERTEREKFPGTREELKVVLEEEYLVSKYSAS